MSSTTSPSTQPEPDSNDDPAREGADAPTTEPDGTPVENPSGRFTVGVTGSEP